MQRSVQSTITSIVILATVALFGVSLHAQTKPALAPIPTPVALTSGRWQVVNGAPEFRNMVMLLDTATGQTWIQCADSQGAQGWCRMFLSEAPTGGKTEK